MTKKNSRSWQKVCIVLAAITSLTVLEVIALKEGFDGTLLNITIAAIAGLGGFVIHTQKSSSK